jgi:hypothetical protein
MKRRRACLALVMLAWLVSCRPASNTAPYKSGRGEVGPDQSLDDTVVVNELYTYTTRDSGKDRYRYVGSPLRLAFAKKYYRWSSNMDGGPQMEVQLLLDAGTLRPAVDVIRERYGAKTLDDVDAAFFSKRAGKGWLPPLYDDQILVVIDSRNAFKDLSSGTWILAQNDYETQINSVRESIKSGTAASLGLICGFSVFDNSKNSPTAGYVYDKNEKIKPPYPGISDSKFGNRDVVGINPNKLSTVRAFSCQKDIPICIVHLNYRRYYTYVRSSRNNICKFRSSLENVTAFLDSHAKSPFPDDKSIFSNIGE